MTEDYNRIRLVLRDLLREEWGQAGTVTATDPFIHTGWHIPDQDQPEVTIGPEDDSPGAVGGASPGDTGFTGIDPSTGQPVQQVTGICQIHAWADYDEVSSTENPKDVVDDYKSEIRRIVGTHWNISAYTFPSSSDVTGDDIQYIAPHGAQYRPDDDANPINHRHRIRVGYGYRNAPPAP